jgi:hypothetical protein
MRFAEILKAHLPPGLFICQEASTMGTTSD